MIMVLGAGFTVLLAYGVESFSRYRKSRPSGDRDQGDDDEDHPTDDRKSTQVEDDLARHREAIRAHASGSD